MKGQVEPSQSHSGIHQLESKTENSHTDYCTQTWESNNEMKVLSTKYSAWETALHVADTVTIEQL
jgi:hypothetical protein